MITSLPFLLFLRTSPGAHRLWMDTWEANMGPTCIWETVMQLSLLWGPRQ